MLVFEDLHWADDGLLAFVDHLVEWSRSAPILLVSLARPELLDRRSDWGSGRRHFMNLPLEPLPDAAMRELLAGLVPGLPATAATAIVERADGVPLYAVETVRMLVAEGRLAAQPDGTYQPVGRPVRAGGAGHAPVAHRGPARCARSRRPDAAPGGQRAGPVVHGGRRSPRSSRTCPTSRHGWRRSSAGSCWSTIATRAPRSAASTRSCRRSCARSRTARSRARTGAGCTWLRHATSRASGEDGAPGALAAQYLAAWTASAGGPEADALAGQARIALRSAAERAAALGSMEQAVALLRQALEVTSDDDERATIMERAGDSGRRRRADRDVAEELLVAAQADLRGPGRPRRGGPGHRPTRERRCPRATAARRRWR